MIAQTKLKPVSGPYAFIRLSSHKAALVDEKDYARLNRFYWSAQKAHGREYAVRKEIRYKIARKIYMHRVVAKTPPGLVCHHVNGFGLDNRRANLQNLTRGEHDHTRWNFV